MRYDSALAGIYDESGLEIENAELLFMDQGVLVFRAYSNGHPYDTSQVCKTILQTVKKTYFRIHTFTLMLWLLSLFISFIQLIYICCTKLAKYTLPRYVRHIIV